MNRSLFLTTLILFLLATQALAANRFIDNTADAGGNGSDSTTSSGDNSHAFKSFTQVATVGLSPGDTLFFKKGQVFRTAAFGKATTDSNFDWGWAGTAANPIVVTGYSSGHRPIISGARNPLVSGNKAWYKSAGGTNTYYLAVSPDSSNPGYDQPRRFYINMGNGNTINGWPIERKELAIGSGLTSLAESTWIWGDGDSKGFSTIYCRLGPGPSTPPTLNVEIPQYSHSDGLVYSTSAGGSDHYVRWEGIVFEMTRDPAATPTCEGLSPITANGWHVTDCVFRNIMGAGYMISNGCSLHVVSNSRFYENGEGLWIRNGAQTKHIIKNSYFYKNRNDWSTSQGNGLRVNPNADPQGKFQIRNNTFWQNDLSAIVWGSADSSLIIGNSIRDHNATGGATIAAIYMTGGADNNVFARNMITNFGGQGSGASAIRSQGTGNFRNSFIHNVIRNAAAEAGSTSSRGLFLLGCDTCLVANNTFWRCGVGFEADSSAGGASTNQLTVKNNIFSRMIGKGIWIKRMTSVGFGQLFQDNNIFTAAGAEGVVQHNGTAYASLAAWNSASGHDAASQQGFVGYNADSANGNLRPTSTSIALNGGVNLSGSFYQVGTDPQLDYDGKLIFDPPDIGAFQINSRSPGLYVFMRQIARRERPSESLEDRLGE